MVIVGELWGFQSGRTARPLDRYAGAMESEFDHELNVVMGEEEAKVAIGDDAYRSAPYATWVELLKTFVAEKRCDDCGSRFDTDNPNEEIWGWFVYNSDSESPSEFDVQAQDIEEIEVVEFSCLACLDLPADERDTSHPRTWGSLTFRRPPTGTFPLESDDEDEDAVDGFGDQTHQTDQPDQTDRDSS